MRLNQKVHSPVSPRSLHSQAGIRNVIGMRLVVVDRAASSLTAHLFENLAKGLTVGRSLALARRHLFRNGWQDGGIARDQNVAAMNPTRVADPSAQWTVPVFLVRAKDGPLLDRDSEYEKRPPLKIGERIPGDERLIYPVRGQFVGRRKQIRSYLRPFLTGDNKRLMISGCRWFGENNAGWLVCPPIAGDPSADPGSWFSGPI